MMSYLYVMWFIMPPVSKSIVVLLAVDWVLVFTHNCHGYYVSQSIPQEDVVTFFKAIAHCADLPSSSSESIPMRSYHFSNGITIDSSNIRYYCDTPEWREFNSVHPNAQAVHTAKLSAETEDTLRGIYNVSVVQPNHVAYIAADLGFKAALILTVFVIIKIISD